MNLNVGGHVTGRVREARWGPQEPLPFTKAAMQLAKGQKMPDLLTLTVAYKEVEVVERYFVNGALETLLRGFDIVKVEDLVGFPVAGVVVAEERSLQAPWLIRLSSYRYE